MLRFPRNFEDKKHDPRRLGGVLSGLCTAFALAAAGWFFWLLQSEVDATDFTRVETSSVRMDTGAGWVDPRWEMIVRDRIARVAPFACDDPGSLELLQRELESLPFVRSMSPPEVLWPDGVRVALKLRPPIACVRVGEEYFGIANDGMLLPGAWPTPPASGRGFLPEIVIGEAASKRWKPGQVVWNDAVADGLSVASSMWSELDGPDLERLGTSIIDARKARRTSVEEPGTVIYLEHSRRVLFGRAPSTTEPGELPVETKWLHLANALLCLPSGPALQPGGPPSAQPGAVDWELVEVRWDHPAMLPRGGKPAERVPVKSVKPARNPAAAPKPKADKPKTETSAKLGLVH